jgi:hypothetical protein
MPSKLDVACGNPGHSEAILPCMPPFIPLIAETSQCCKFSLSQSCSESGTGQQAAGPWAGLCGNEMSSLCTAGKAAQRLGARRANPKPESTLTAARVCRTRAESRTITGRQGTLLRSRHINTTVLLWTAWQQKQGHSLQRDELHPIEGVLHIVGLGVAQRHQ